MTWSPGKFICDHRTVWRSRSITLCVVFGGIAAAPDQLRALLDNS